MAKHSTKRITYKQIAKIVRQLDGKLAVFVLNDELINGEDWLYKLYNVCHNKQDFTFEFNGIYARVPTFVLDANDDAGDITRHLRKLGAGFR